MPKKTITVGRRFSKKQIEEDELSLIKSGSSKKIRLQDLLLLRDEFSFESDLKHWKSWFTERLKEKNLPTEPFYYPVDENHNEWQPKAPKGLTEQDVFEKRINLSEYLLILGYDFDSAEYLAGKALSQIYSIEKAMKLNMHKEALEFAFGLGCTITLYSVYQQTTRDSISGGLGKENPLRKYGSKLLKKYPHLSQRQIWQKIPRGISIDEEPDSPDVYKNFLFYKTMDGDKEVLVTKDDTTGIIKTNTYDSFRTKYLSKDPSKKI